MRTHLLTLLFISLFGIAHANPVDSVKTTSSTCDCILAYMKHAMLFSKYYPQEKVYLHLDNTGYFKGETIWFKAYVTRCDNGHTTDLSKVLYVELLNPSGDVVKTRKLKIEDGQAYGDIKVDNIMVTGFYEIRAYTRYMTNWGGNACFSRVLPIFKEPRKEGDYSNPTLDKFSYNKRLHDNRTEETGNADIISLTTQDDGSATTSRERGGKLKVNFYPEGGHLVKGLPCRVAFTVMDGEGRPVSTKVHMMDSAGNVTDSVATDWEGRGVVNMDPEWPVTALSIQEDQRGAKVFNLPEWEDEGCGMAVDVTDDNDIMLTIMSSESIRGRKLGYVLVNGGNIAVCDTLTAEERTDIAFVRATMPKGVNQITLFDSNGRILAERQFFIHPNDEAESTITVENETDNLTPCGKVNLTLRMSPKADLSFTAVDAATTVNGFYGNIRTWMLLGSELKGYISNPEYYLEADDAEHRKATDLLMMVQGWRHYDWKLMSGQSMFGKLQPIENRLMIYGTIRGKKKDNPVDGISLTSTMYNSKGRVLEGNVQTDSLGRYCFSLPDINGEWNLQIQSRLKEKETDYIIGIDRHFSPSARKLSPMETMVLPVDTNRLLGWDTSVGDDPALAARSKHHIVTDNVVVKAKKRIWDETAWNDETEARHYSFLYFDCDKGTDRIADEGGNIPLLSEWLKTQSGLFEGDDEQTDVLLMKKGENILETDTVGPLAGWFYPEPVPPEFEFAPPTPWKKFFRDGLTYKKRPIVWIVDNIFVTITGFKMKGRLMPVNFTFSDNNANTVCDPPQMLEDVRCVYLSENPKSMLAHVKCQEIEEMNPVVVHCFTHRSFVKKQKGLRRTHFQGYNEPQTFQMEDYSVLPPMEDFRRTIYWNPNVKTDSEGKATVEFYNNSSCTEMFISAEGMTKDGRFVVY